MTYLRGLPGMMLGSLLACACGGLTPVHAQVGPGLIVAGTGIGLGKVLDKLQEKVTHLIQQAAAAGSLLSTKVARDLELEIQAVREQLHAELNQQWDRLSQEKISVLREMDQMADRLEKNLAHVGKIADDLSLDIDDKLNRIPWLKKSRSIRRVRGSSQYYRSDGLYMVTVTGNLFDQTRAVPAVAIEGLPPSASIHTRLQPPHDLILQIDAAALESRFKDRALTYVPIVISERKPRKATYRFELELFPRYPAGYRLTEYLERKDVDVGQTQVTLPRLTYIPGCGNDGCNAYYTICEDVPAGAQPITAVDYYDSFAGWGGFATATVNASGTAMCAQYWQHSHNVGRNVGFRVQYHPLGTKVVRHDLTLEAMSGDRPAAAAGGAHMVGIVAADKRAANHNTQASSSQSSSLNTIVTVLTDIPAGLVTTQPLARFDVQDAAAFGIAPQGAFTPLQQTVVDMGAVRFGRTYSARFDNGMKSFDLVFRLFTGEEIVVTPGQSDVRVKASPIETLSSFKRMTVRLEPPW